MKFLPDQPPPAVPGRAAQGGAAGPFVRSARTPVDPKTKLQVRVRSWFGSGAETFRYQSAPERADWDALAVPGAPGRTAAAGYSAANTKPLTVPVPTAPAGAAAPEPIIWTVSFSLSTGFLIDARCLTPFSGQLVVGATSFRASGGAPAGLYPTVFRADISTPYVADVTSGYLERWGVPPVGFLVLFYIQFFLAQVPGPTSFTSVTVAP